MGNKMSRDRDRVLSRHQTTDTEEHQTTKHQTTEEKTDCEGYLISYCATLIPHPEHHEYVLKEGTIFHFEPYHPSDSVVVCLTYHFHMNEDNLSKLDKTIIKDKVKQVLTERGLSHVQACVLVSEEPMEKTGQLEEVTGHRAKVIHLSVRVPDSVSGQVTDQDIMTPLSEYISSTGYSVNHVDFTGTLVSSGKVTLKQPSSSDDLHIPKGTKFTFYYFRSDQACEVHKLFVTTKEDYLLIYKKRHIYFLGSDAILEDTSILIINLSYYFSFPSSSHSPFSADCVADRLAQVLESSHYSKYIVTTEIYTTNTSINQPGPTRTPVTPHKWVGIQLTPIIGTEIPNVQTELNAYFSDTSIFPYGPYDVLPQTPPPTDALSAGPRLP